MENKVRSWRESPAVKEVAAKATDIEQQLVAAEETAARASATAAELEQQLLDADAKELAGLGKAGEVARLRKEQAAAEQQAARLRRAQTVLAAEREQRELAARREYATALRSRYAKAVEEQLAKIAAAVEADAEVKALFDEAVREFPGVPRDVKLCGTRLPPAAGLMKQDVLKADDLRHWRRQAAAWLEEYGRAPVSW